MPDKDWQAESERLQRRQEKAPAILGAPEAADRTAIRDVFHRMSRAHRPDTDPGNGTSGVRFHLIRCACKSQTGDEARAALGDLGSPTSLYTNGKYRPGSPWGYSCWWHENYFGGLTEEEHDANL